MQTRAKALTVTIALVLAFAVLPTLGAAAAEPLPDGSYEIVLDGASYTLQVVDGTPVVDDVEGVDFEFRFDATGRVLDEFEVGVADKAYEVEVAEDGTVSVDETSADGWTDEVIEFMEVAVEDEPETEDLDDEVEDDEATQDQGDHGALVSSVAQCAPSGKVARDAGLPNHGTFVRAVARGETIAFEVDGEAYTADLSTPEGTAAFCALAAELVAAAEAPDATDDSAEEGAVDAEPEERGNGNGNGKANGNGNGNGKANAPGQQKKND